MSRVVGLMSDTKQRFLRMVNKVATGCHEWTSVVHRDGYGKFYYEGKQAKAHRVSYLLFVGEIPDGLHVLHRCDNRKCVNPEHLYAGTPKQNTADKIARFKGMWGRMKFNSEQINRCKELYSSGVSQARVAEMLGMDQTTVSRFVRDKYFKRI